MEPASRLGHAVPVAQTPVSAVFSFSYAPASFPASSSIPSHPLFANPLQVYVHSLIMKSLKMESQNLTSRVRSLEIEIAFLKAQHTSDLESVRQLVKALFHQIAEQGPSTLANHAAEGEANGLAADANPDPFKLNDKYRPPQPSSEAECRSPRLIPRDPSLYPAPEAEPNPLDLNDRPGSHDDSMQAQASTNAVADDASTAPKYWTGGPWSARMRAEFNAKSIGRSPEETERLRKFLGYEPRPDIPYHFTSDKPRSPLPSVIRPINQQSYTPSDMADEPSVYYPDSDDEESLCDDVCLSNEVQPLDCSDEDVTLPRSSSSKDERSPITEETSFSSSIPDVPKTACANRQFGTPNTLSGIPGTSRKVNTTSVNCPVPRFDFGTDVFTDSKSMRMNLLLNPQHSTIAARDGDSEEAPIGIQASQNKDLLLDEPKPSLAAPGQQPFSTATPVFNASPSTDRLAYIRQRSLALGQRRALALAESQQQRRDDMLRRSDSGEPPDLPAAEPETPTKLTSRKPEAASEPHSSVTQAVTALITRYGEEARGLILSELDKQGAVTQDQHLPNTRATRMHGVRSSNGPKRAVRRKVNYTDLDDSDRESRGGPWPADTLLY